MNSFRKLITALFALAVFAGCAGPTYLIQVDGKDVEKGKIVIEHRNTYVPAYAVPAATMCWDPWWNAMRPCATYPYGVGYGVGVVPQSSIYLQFGGRAPGLRCDRWGRCW